MVGVVEIFHRVRNVQERSFARKSNGGATIETWVARVVTRLCGFSPLINCNFDDRTTATSPSEAEILRWHDMSLQNFSTLRTRFSLETNIEPREDQTFAILNEQSVEDLLEKIKKFLDYTLCMIK